MVAKVKFSLTDLLNSNSKTIGSANGAFNAITGAGNNFEIIWISVYDLEPSKDNFYSVEDVADLKDSIELFGIQQNLIVKPIVDSSRYKVIAGHRRRVASIGLVEEGKKQFELVPCRIETSLDDIKAKILLIYTNSTTRQLSDWEKVEQLVQLKDLLKEYKKTHDLPGRVRELLAETLNMSITKVGRIETINDNLTVEFKEELKQDNISFSTAAELARLSVEDQKAVYEQHQQTGVTKLKDVKKAKRQEDETFINSSQMTVDAVRKIKSLLETQVSMAERSRMQELKIASDEKTEITERIRILGSLIKTVDKELFEMVGQNVFEG